MPEYESSYQHVEGIKALKAALEVNLDDAILARIGREIGHARTGLIQSFNPQTHISELFLRAQQLVTRTKLPHVVLAEGSFFVLNPDGEFTGPLAYRCRPNPASARSWAETALRWGDAQLFEQANVHLPRDPSVLCSPINGDVMRRAFAQAVAEFQSAKLSPGMTVGVYSSSDSITRETHQAGMITSLTQGGAMISFSRDGSSPPIEVPRTELFNPNRALQIAVEIDQKELLSRN